MFSRRTLLLLAALVWPSLLHAQAPAAPTDLQLFLLIGQSNMAGRGVVEPQDGILHPRIFMLDAQQQWVPAKDPVHFDKKIAGVGLASEFARTLAARDPDAKVGLIPCAVGGTSLDQWAPGQQLYQNAVTRTKAALQNGHLRGILWHQGEADSAPEKVSAYAGKFARLIAQLRQDLNTPAVPVIAGELGHFRAASTAYNQALPSITPLVPRFAWVSAEGLADKGDQLHFGSPALREFGRRYAQAYLQLDSGEPKAR